MPELPEVEVVKLGLEKKIPGKQLIDCWDSSAKKCGGCFHVLRFLDVPPCGGHVGSDILKFQIVLYQLPSPSGTPNKIASRTEPNTPVLVVAERIAKPHTQPNFQT